MRDKIKQFFFFKKQNPVSVWPPLAGVLLLYGILCFIHTSPGTAVFSGSGNIDQHYSSDFLCASAPSSSASRLLRNGRQRNFQPLREEDSRFDDDYGSVGELPSAGNILLRNYSSKATVYCIFRNFWTDFYISALPVRAGPGKFLI